MLNLHRQTSVEALRRASKTLNQSALAMLNFVIKLTSVATAEIFFRVNSLAQITTQPVASSETFSLSEKTLHAKRGTKSTLDAKKLINIYWHDHKKTRGTLVKREIMFKGLIDRIIIRLRSRVIDKDGPLEFSIYFC